MSTYRVLGKCDGVTRAATTHLALLCSATHEHKVLRTRR